MGTKTAEKGNASSANGQVVIYSSLEGVLSNFLSAYKDAHQLDTNHVSAYSAHPTAIYERITREITAGSQTADLVILPHYMILQMQQEGLLRSYTSMEAKAYPKEFWSEKGWAALTVEINGIAHNPRRIKRYGLPTTVEELAKPKWKGRIALQTLTKYPEGKLGFYFITAMKRHLGEERWRSFLSNLAENVEPTSFDCLAKMADSVVKGEHDFAIPSTLRRLSLVDPAEGALEFLILEDLPQMASFKTVALIKKGLNPELAKQYFDFAISQSYQEHIGKNLTGELPARPNVKTRYCITRPNLRPTHYFPSKDNVANFSSGVKEIRNLGLI
jgi:ABC-type Fe3+ transport system substrate-binding protein